MQLGIILVQETEGTGPPLRSTASINHCMQLAMFTAPDMFSLLLIRRKSNCITVGYCQNLSAATVPLGISWHAGHGLIRRHHS